MIANQTSLANFLMRRCQLIVRVFCLLAIFWISSAVLILFNSLRVSSDLARSRTPGGSRSSVLKPVLEPVLHPVREAVLSQSARQSLRQ